MGTDNTTFTDHVAQALRRAATEIEELRVQASLGKAEAKEKYEEIKKKFNSYVHEAKSQVNEGMDKYDDIRQKMDELKVQLALGKAEGYEAFQEQKKKILASLKELEDNIRTNPTVNRVYAILLIEIEKFKVQLEWLEEKLKEGGEKAADTFEKQKEEFNKLIQRIADKFSKDEDEEDKSRWDHFQNEVSAAFSHLKSAVKKP